MRAAFLLLLCACQSKGPGEQGTAAEPDDSGSSIATSLTTTGPLGRTPPALDLADLDDADLWRVHGSGDDYGNYGLPVTGGFDVDGDGHLDVAMGNFKTSALGRSRAGMAYLAFGDSTVSGTIDTAVLDGSVVLFAGSAVQEHSASELWMDDLTGDGLGELVIAAQDYSAPGRVGSGAVHIVFGGSAVREAADNAPVVDLAGRDGPPRLTLVGAETMGRLGIWLRSGDATGDGIADLLIGSDQEHDHRGGAWLIEGGSHLLGHTELDLANVASSPLAEHILRIVPPTSPSEQHLGATATLVDLDGDGVCELAIAATLNRAGASLEPLGATGETHGSAGAPHGEVWIVWDEELAKPWSGELSVDLPSSTHIIGGNINNTFGEELSGGDFDGDGERDLFVGDLVADFSAQANRPHAGSAHVLYSIAQAKGERFVLTERPESLFMSTFLGAGAGHIASDTAAVCDVDGDGVDDLSFSAPDSSPGDRSAAGTLYVVFGGQRWPATVDLHHDGLPGADRVEVLEVWGAEGTTGIHEQGDMIAYSMGTGDYDGDGKFDLVINEMLGDGLQPYTNDVGNVIVVPGRVLSEAAGR